MTVPYYGDFAEDASVIMVFNTFTSNDPSASSTITDFVAGDVKIHKDGHVDQKASADGVAVFVNFDSITGNHMITIDTSNDTGAAGFWVKGNEYQVRIEGTTIDAATVNAFIGTFSIERAGGVLAVLKAGTVDVNTKTITAGIIANATFNADVGSTGHATNLIALAVRKILEELQLDTLAGIDTGVAVDGDLSSHVITGSVLAHIMAANKDVTTSYNCSTDSLEAIKVHADTIKAETALTVADTNEIQGKLPTNKFMGSSDGADDDGTLNNILTDTAEIGAAGVGLTEAGGDGDHLTAINLPNQTMDIVGNITGNLSGSVGSITGHTVQTGDGFARLGAPAGVSVSADILAIKTVDDAIKVITDALTAGGAAKLALAATTMITGTVNWDVINATTTVIYSNDVTEATADHFNGRLFVPTSGALVGQYTDITDYALVGAEGKFTVTALTEAPANDTTFVIL